MVLDDIGSSKEQASRERWRWRGAEERADNSNGGVEIRKKGKMKYK
jgi:hypothetical protein